MRTYWIALAAVVLLLTDARGAITNSAWMPIYRGIDHATGTNDNAGGRTHSVNVLRVDLQEPTVELFMTPAFTNNYVPNVRETPLETPGGFLRKYRVQAAINSMHFSPGSYSYPPGTASDLHGWAVQRGQVISPFRSTNENNSDPAVSMFLFGTNKEATFIFNASLASTNTPGVYTAISAMYPLLHNGVNVSYAYTNAVNDTLHRLQPRTAFGLSQDRRYLFLLTIDGRQSDFSDGAYDYETADWLIRFGAADGAAMDGGGSTCVVVADECGDDIALNQNSYQFAPHSPPELTQRPIGCVFGLYARNASNIINDVNVVVGNSIALVTWTTTEPASGLLEYGPTPALGFSQSSTNYSTNHAFVLTGLRQPSTDYFRISTVTTNGLSYRKAICTFNVPTNASPPLSNNSFAQIFPLTQAWRYTTNNLDGVNWKSPTYDDVPWFGPSNALLYVEDNVAVTPRNTPLPIDSASGFPFVTYYFRTHFDFTQSTAGVVLLFSNYLDDGAVFYLNGTELDRPMMPPLPAVIYNSTIASNYYCRPGGDATCPLVFASRPGPGVLRSNDNVLAVEVHNYRVNSPDLVFGCALSWAVLSPQTNLLVVLSSNPAVGVEVTVDPADAYRATNGVTPFERFYGADTAVTLTAATNSSGGSFTAWAQDGSTLSTSNTVTVVVTNGTMVTALYGSPSSPEPPPLSISRDGSEISISWTGVGFTLQESPTPVAGAWQDIAGSATTNSWNSPTTNGAGFYRLRN